MLTVDKPSLLQQKKQQWAREREEMSHLYSPWGTGGGRYTDRLHVRNQFASSIDLHNDTSYEYQEPSQRQRSPSLPPIRNPSDATAVKEDVRSKDTLNRNLSSAKRFAFYDEDGEGDTSGYGSETVNMGMRKNGSRGGSNPVVAWQHNHDDDRKKVITEDISNNEGQWSGHSPRSISAEEGRPRWGDRGVATGRLWEPTAANDRLPQMTNEKKGTPSWVERGLNMINIAAEVLVIDQSSSNSALDCDRSSFNGSDEGRSFLRGQNVPIEPEIRAQRENKRIKALELQSAILSQLEDQERKKQEDRERKLKEEKMEELRILKQQQQDKLKYEEEKRKLEERQFQEQKKLEMLKKALEDAEQKAKREKEKRFNKYKYNVNDDTKSEISQPQSSSTSIRYEPELNSRNVNIQKEMCKESEKMENQITNRSYECQSKSLSINNQGSRQTTEFNSPRSVRTNNFYVQNVPPLTLSENQYSILPIGISEDIINSKQNGLQLAVLVPQNLSNSLYNLSLNSETIDNSAKTLTPRKYRTLKYKDASTQTDSSFIKSTVDKANETDNNGPVLTKDYQNIDENAPQESTHSTLKKERRLRIEERFKKDLESRPKWGVNRPVAQYKKQSEKDPFYSQKRKIRQKHRPQHRQYLSQSSDDSRSPSPPIRADKLPITYRNSMSQSYWRHKRSSQDLSVKIINEVPDGGSNDTTDPKKSPTNDKLSPSKRMTLSQKFINDKYGNRKLWNDEIVTDRNIKSHSLDVENRKKIIEQLNVAKKEYFECLENENNIDHRVMSKLEDIFDKKKDEAPMLDLSKTIINTAEEYREVLDKVPEFKTRPEKVKAEDVKIKDRLEDQKTKTSRKEIRAYEKLGTRGYEEKNFTFMDPIPVEMRALKFEDLCTVPIEWRMLTSIRPKSKLDEEYFNRLIELRKSELRTKARDKREFAKNSMVRKTKNRSGVTESRIVSCAECGEEYCDGKMCIISNYDMFARLKVEIEQKAPRSTPAQAQGGAKLRKLRRRVRRKPRSKSAAPARDNSKLTKSGAKSDSEI